MGQAVTSASDYDIDVSETVGQVRDSRFLLAPFDWFSRLWGVAIVAHIVGNPRIGQVFADLSALGVASLALGLVAIALIVRPSDRRLLGVASGLVLITVWLEAPLIGNHWLLAGLLSIAILISLSTGDSWNWFSSTGRGIHLVFYGFAAFAKLNSSFFDPSASCAVVYANQELNSVGLPVLATNGTLALLVIYGSAFIELVIPVLLIRERTRNVGIGLGLVFHTLISFDLDQHFFDFTALLIPLFLLWSRASLPQPLGRPFGRRVDLMVAGILGVFVLSTVMPLSAVTLVLLRRGAFVLWIPASIALVVFAVRRLGLPSEFSLRLPDAVAWILVGLVALNGLTPYLELKTGTSWNMYSNLYTVDGESNHFVIRSTLPLSNAQADPITVLGANDAGLSEYVDSGYLLPERTFLDYLAQHPGAEASVLQSGRERVMTSQVDGQSPNPILERFGLFRAIDSQSPVRCQTVWLPAR